MQIRDIDENENTIENVDWSKWRRIRVEEHHEDGVLIEIISHCERISDEEIDAKLKTPLTPTEKLLLLAETIPEENYPDLPPKAGYKYQREYSASSGSIVWIFVIDPNNPVEYIEGMSVTEGLYYTDGNSKYICILSGTPESLEDTEYFEKEVTL